MLYYIVYYRNYIIILKNERNSRLQKRDQRGSSRNVDSTVSPVGCAKMIVKKTFKMTIQNPDAVMNGVIQEKKKVYYINTR